MPFVKPDKNGRLTYERRIPAPLRPFLEGKACIRRTLPGGVSDIRNPNVLTAYSSTHSEVNERIEQAKKQSEQLSAPVKAGKRGGIQRQGETFPLSKRDIAGIAAEWLLRIRASTETEKDLSKQMVQELLRSALKAKQEGTEGVSLQDIGRWTQPILDELEIEPSPQDLQAIGTALLRYIPVMKGDMEQLLDGDYSEPKLKTVAPPMPKRQATWSVLLKEWLRKSGGVLQKDGFGVSDRRESHYRIAIAEFEEQISRDYPAELTAEQARAYVRWLQGSSGLANGTQQDRLTCLKNLFKVGRSEGLVFSNPFEGITISTPAGLVDSSGYRPLTKEEIKQLFELLKSEKETHYRYMHYLLLATGARLSEILQLRTTDIKQTDKGVWFIDFKHQPLHKYPMLLKTKAKNERQCPIHQRVIDEGLLDIKRNHKGRLFINASQNSTTYSQFFKHRLQKLGIWEPKKTVVHSLRGTAKDLWREAGISADYRNSFTGHQSKDIGESSYGYGLRSMPDITAKEMEKLDLSWLP